MNHHHSKIPSYDDDPRYALFDEMIGMVKRDEPQVPFEVSEVDSRFYTDETWFQREMEEIFQDVPLMLAPSAMLKQPGDHWTHDDAGKPILVARGKDDEIRAFLNVCRHRGVRLADAPTVQRKATFTCPYHHWTYDLKGDLRGVPLPESFPGFDKSCRNLVDLPIEDRHGFLWVNPNKNGKVDLDEFLGSLNLDFAGFDAGSGHMFKQTRQIRKTNWKLIIEAFQDGYHVKRLHHKTVGGFFLDGVAAMDVEKQHLRAIVARNEFMDALDLPREEWDLRNHVSFAHFVWPNTVMVWHPDYVSQLSLYPKSVDETVVIHSCLVSREPENEKELAHFERGFEIIENGVFGPEDLHTCEQAQIGMASGANETMLIGGHETGIRRFHQILKDHMGPFIAETG